MGEKQNPQRADPILQYTDFSKVKLALTNHYVMLSTIFIAPLFETRIFTAKDSTGEGVNLAAVLLLLDTRGKFTSGMGEKQNPQRADPILQYADFSKVKLALTNHYVMLSTIFIAPLFETRIFTAKDSTSKIYQIKFCVN
ncbi:unnamed protein product [Wuchereria bancrofti]|uniref:Uncharacterized protein n=1 Tax=Wuchereria bancrofti TaxID=6293 RepID=A0A3P7E5T1_WUCBA|nr:unnamed protein product [Wuchereria bancrofti]